jgi:hypothetical protein
MRLSADNGSTFISSNDYVNAGTYGNNKTVNTNSSSSGTNTMSYMFSSDNYGLPTTPATTVGFLYFSNWYDSSKYSTVVGGDLGYNTNDSSIYRSLKTKTLQLTATHNAFQVYANNASYVMRAGTTISLYGLV